MDLSRDWRIEVAGENCLVLNEWHLLPGSVGQTPPRAVTPYPVLNVLQTYDVPPHLRGEKDLWYCARLYVRGSRPKAALVLERSTFQRPFEIMVNGKPAGQPKGPSRRYDAMNLEVAIGHLLTASPQGALNQIAVRVANNTATVRGTKARPMMDALRLFGDFGVRFPYVGYALAEISHPSGIAELERLRDWADLGLPQYSGTVRYRKTVEISPEEARRAIALEFDEVHDLVRVSVNGRLLGTLAWPPYVLDLTGRLRPGKNEILLAVANSPINMIEGLAKKSGVLGNVRVTFSK